MEDVAQGERGNVVDGYAAQLVGEERFEMGFFGGSEGGCGCGLGGRWWLHVGSEGVRRHGG